MSLKKKLRQLWHELVEKVQAWVAEQNAAIDAARASEETDVAGTGELGAKPWNKCVYSSNWNQKAAQRMMNLVSPKFSDEKAKQYLDWQESLGCDHCHLLLVNRADGEGAGYDALGNASDKAVALRRIQEIRRRGLGVVAWIVADDSDDYRQKIFNAPTKYATSLADFFPYLSYVVLGLEMDEGKGSAAQWTALRDAVKKAGWTGKIATHHTAGNRNFISLGDIVMDQLDTSCTASRIASSVKKLISKGKAVCGFEYSRDPDRARAQAALDAGAFGCGNWAGGASTSTVATSSDAVPYASLEWRYGKFNGSKAALTSARIKNLKVSSSSLSYSWESGGCETLNSACTHDNPVCTCALFCRVGGKWIGGKFEHISTDRKTRDLGNIMGGYGGWDKATFTAADAYAFVILDDGAKRRTNVITQGV